MTSSILPPRSDLAPCSPMTQLSASSTFDLPDPFGPTTQVIPGSKRSVVAEAKDLKPFSVRLLRCTVRDASQGQRGRLSRRGYPPGTPNPRSRSRRVAWSARRMDPDQQSTPRRDLDAFDVGQLDGGA